MLCTTNVHMALTQVLEEETRRLNQELDTPMVDASKAAATDPKQLASGLNEDDSTLADDPTQVGKRKLKRGSLDQLA